MMIQPSIFSTNNNSNVGDTMDAVSKIRLNMEMAVSQARAVEKIRNDFFGLHAKVTQTEIASGSWLDALLSSADSFAKGLDEFLIVAGGAYLGLLKTYPRLCPNEFGFSAFISHYKIEGGTVAEHLVRLAKTADESLPPIFLDSNNTERLDLLMLDVYRSDVFVLILAPHKKETKEKGESEFGVFSRPYCVVEMVAASKSKKSCVPLVVIPDDLGTFLPNQIPQNEQEVKALLDYDGWKKVNETTGLTTNECVEHVLYVAKHCLDKTKVVELRQDNAKEYPKDLMKAFESMKLVTKENNDNILRVLEEVSVVKEEEVSFVKGEISLDKTTGKPFALIAADAELKTEIQYLISATKSEFKNLDASRNTIVESSLANLTTVKDVKFLIVVLSKGMFTNEVLIKHLIAANKSNIPMVSLKVSKIGWDEFAEYGKKPDESLLKSKQIDVKECFDAFEELFKNLSKVTYTPHADASLIRINMKLFWKALKLNALDIKSNLLPEIADFSSTMVKKANEYAPGTRLWVFDQMFQWVDSSVKSGKSNVFVVEGTAGLGKSVILSTVVKNSSDTVRMMCDNDLKSRNQPVVVDEALKNSFGKAKVEVVAYHFFKHDDSVVSSPFNCLGSIARQLSFRFSGVKLKLEENLSKIKNDSDLKDLKTLFRVCVLEPCLLSEDEEIKSNKKTFLVCLDALDECDANERKNMMDVIANAWVEMPKAFGLIVSTRPDVDLPVKFGKFDPFVLKQNDKDNKKDVEIYLSNAIGREENGGEDWFKELKKDQVQWKEGIATLVDRSDGLFLYAAFALQNLIDVKRMVDIGMIKNLPAGMDGMYVDYFTRFLRDLKDNRDLYCSVLAPIVAARVPLPFDVWKQVVLSFLLNKQSEVKIASTKEGKERYFKEQILKPIGRLLNLDGGVVTVIHKSMSDFLLNPKYVSDLGVSKREGHELLFDVAGEVLEESLSKLEEVWGGIKEMEEETNVYFASHAGFHFVEKYKEEGKLSVKELEKSRDWDKASNWFGNFQMIYWNVVGSVNRVGADGMDRILNDFGSFLELMNALVESKNNLRKEEMDQFGLLVKKVSLMEEVLTNAFQALLYDHRQLAGQVLGRMGWENSFVVGKEDEKMDDNLWDSKAREDWKREAKEWMEKAGKKGNLKVAKPVPYHSGLNLVGGRLKKIISGHTGKVYTVSYSADKKTMASGSKDNTIRIWDCKSGKELQLLEGHSNWVTSICYSPDGQILASGSADNTIRIWDCKSGKELMVLNGHSDKVTSVCYSPNGQTLASGSQDKTIRIRDCKSGKELLVLSGHSGYVTSVCYSPDGQTLASGSWDKTIRTWDCKNGKELLVLRGHSDEVASVCYSLDGQTVASGSWDKTIRVWDCKIGKELLVLKGHSTWVTSICYSPNGQTLASGSFDETIRLWDGKSGKGVSILDSHSHKVTSVCYSPDGETLASGSWDDTIRIWDCKSGKELMDLSGHSDYVRSVCFCPNGQTLASGSHDETIRIWDCKSGKELFVLRGHSKKVTSVCYAPDGQKLASGSGDKTIRIWDCKSGKELLVLSGHSGEVTSVCYSPDGQTLTSGSWDNTIRKWDCKSVEKLLCFYGHSDSVTSLSYSPDGERLASGSYDKTIRIWDCKNGKQLLVLNGHSRTVSSVCFSHNGQTLVSVSWDETIRIWDCENGNKLKSIDKQDSENVKALAESYPTISGLAFKNINNLESSESVGISLDYSVAISFSRNVGICGMDGNNVYFWSWD